MSIVSPSLLAYFHIFYLLILQAKYSQLAGMIAAEITMGPIRTA